MNVASLLMRAGMSGFYQTTAWVGRSTPEEQADAEQAMETQGWPVAADSMYNRVVLMAVGTGYQAKRETWTSWAAVCPTVAEAVAALDCPTQRKP